MNKLNAMLFVSLMLASCAGRNPNHITVIKPGDETLSCSYIRGEMAEIDRRIQVLLPESQKTGKNVALGAAGVILFPAWFFMDFSDVEKIEIDQLKQRYEHLMRIYNDKQCSKKE